MQVRRITAFSELQNSTGEWMELARGVPFRSFEWLESWWRHYGQRSSTGKRQLYTLAVYDDEQRLIGVAPWFLERSKSLGRVLRFLGSGEVCSDYLSLLCRPEDQDCVTQAVAVWLTEAARGDLVSDCNEDHRWDLLHLCGVDAEDQTLTQLLKTLSELGSEVHHREGPRCWRIALPENWDEYVGSLSKSHRKQVRRLERSGFESNRVTCKRAETAADLARGLQILIDLHQRRRQSLGQPGCFSSPEFLAFHQEVIPRLLAADMLRLTWLELDGLPLAVEYHLAGAGVVYAYQSGLDPAALDEEPGRLAAIATLQQSIQEGAQAFDFLRGDEPYKAHWRAEPRQMLDAHVVPCRTSARLRHGVLSAGGSLKSLIKSGLEATGVWAN